MQASLIDRLVCPETKQRVVPADKNLLERLNAAIAAGGVRNVDGRTVDAALEGGLVREDRNRLYPICEGIPVMLIGEAIPLESV